MNNEQILSDIESKLENVSSKTETARMLALMVSESITNIFDSKLAGILLGNLERMMTLSDCIIDECNFNHSIIADISKKLDTVMERIAISKPDNQSIGNSLQAFAVGLELGAERDEVVAALKKLKCQDDNTLDKLNAFRLLSTDDIASLGTQLNIGSDKIYNAIEKILLTHENSLSN